MDKLIGTDNVFHLERMAVFNKKHEKQNRLREKKLRVQI